MSTEMRGVITHLLQTRINHVISNARKVGSESHTFLKRDGDQRYQLRCEADHVLSKNAMEISMLAEMRGGLLTF